MKKPSSKSIDSTAIFLCSLFAAYRLSQPEPPLLEEERLHRFIEAHGQDKRISVVHLAEQNSEITKRQISELNRLHQRHDHLFVVAAVNNEDDVKGPCLRLRNESELRYPCVPAPELHHYDKVFRGHYTQTSNIYIFIEDEEEAKQSTFLTGYQDYQQIIQILELDY